MYSFPYIKKIEVNTKYTFPSCFHYRKQGDFIYVHPVIYS